MHVYKLRLYAMVLLLISSSEGLRDSRCNGLVHVVGSGGSHGALLTGDLAVCCLYSLV
jgi:hypothetical protein